MALSSLHCLLFLFLCSLSFPTILSESQLVSQSPLKPDTLVLPVLKDGATNLHVAQINKRTPSLPLHFLVDLNGKFLWVTCQNNYLSSSYRAPRCHSTQCAKAGSHNCRTCSSEASPGCHNNSCGLLSVNPLTNRVSEGELAQDVLSIQSTQGSNPGPWVNVPRFLFSCAPPSLLQDGLPYNAQGVAGFGHTPISLPNQLSSYFGLPPKFALCLTSTPNQNGVVFLGNGPYNFLPGIDISNQLAYTNLISSRQGEYFIELRSIKINNKVVPIDTSLLSINNRGVGGTMLSTTVPYTVLQQSIYTKFTDFFANELSQIPRVDPVAPFGVCFDASKISSTRAGPGVPNIDLVTNNQNTVWSILGANSMVEARPGVLCLGFVNGGWKPRASIVIGTKQIEDNLLQFDIGRSKLGFSSSLLLRNTNCANFNFNSSSSAP